MTRAKLDKLPDELPSGLQLELYKGRWAVEINGNLYVFPQHLTKGEVIKVLEMASIQRKGN